MTFGRKINRILIPGIAKWIMVMLLSTCRVTISGKKEIEAIKNQGFPMIFLFWHRHIFFLTYFFRNTGIHPLISLSEDGSLISRLAEKFKMRPIRGSSSRGGASAFRQLVDCLKIKKEDVLITADGPIGPPRIIKEGVLRLAKITNMPVIPVSWYCSRPKIFTKSWDQFMIPLPLSRIHLSFGKPLYEKDWISRADLDKERIKIEWQEILNRLEEEAKARVVPVSPKETS